MRPLFYVGKTHKSTTPTGRKSRQEKKKDDPNADLEVEFILATEPDTTHVGKLKEIHRAADVRGDQGNTVLIKVEISDEVKARLPHPLRPGATVDAKVRCGYRSVGYVFLREPITFLQSKVLFRWF